MVGNPNWSSSANGDLSTSAWSTANLAVFSAGTDGAGTFNVRIITGNTITGVAGIRFEEGSVSITGQNATSSILTLTNAVVNTVNSGTHTLSARISGSVGLEKQGVGTLVLGNTNNDFIGDITLTAGTLRISSNAHLGAATNDFVFDGGTLQTTATINFGATRVLDFQAGGGTISVTGGTLTLDDAGQITGSGTLIKAGSSTLVISAANTGFSGLAQVDAGTLTLSAADALGSGDLVVNAGTVNATTANALGSSLVTLGGGTLNLNQTNSAGTADFIFAGGLLAIGATINLDALSTLEAASAGTLSINSNQTLTLDDAGQLSGAGSLVRSGGGALVVSGANTTFTGIFTHTAGSTELTAAEALGSADLILNGGTFTAAVADALGSDTITLNGGTLISQVTGATGGGDIVFGAPTAVMRTFHTVGQNLLDRITADSGGQLILDRSIVSAIDLSGAGALRLGSSVGTGTGIELGGAITPSASGYFFGGGAGRLNINTPLAGALPLDVAGTGHVVLQGPHSYTGSTTVSGALGGGSGFTTLELSNAAAVAASSSLTVIGTSVGDFGGNTATLNSGALLLHPGFTYTGPASSPATLVLDNGAIGWNADKTLSALPGTYSANTVSSILHGTPTVTADNSFSQPAAQSARLLHLGGPLSSGVMTNQFSITNDGATPVALVKSGVNSTLDLRSGGTNTHTGGTALLSGTIRIDAADQLSSGPLSLGSGATLHIFETLTLANTLKIYGGNSTSPELEGRINVEAGKTATFNGAVDTSLGPRSILRKDGAGDLVLDFIYQPHGSNVTRWGLNLGAGMTTINQSPRGGNATGAPGANGALIFDGGDLTVKAWTGVTPEPSITNTGYGFEALSVTAGSTSRLYLQDGARLQITTNASPAYGNIAGHLIIDAASGSTLGDGTIVFTGASSSNQGHVGSGTLDLRGGRMLLASASNGVKRILPAENTFTLALNGGFLDTLNPGNMSTLAGHLVINEFNLSGSSAPAVNRFTVDTATSTANDAPFTGTYASTGDTRWHGDLLKTGNGEFIFRRTGGIVVVENDPTLRIEGGTVRAGGTTDVFTDSFDPALHVNADLASSGSALVIETASKNLGRLDGVAGSSVDISSGLILTLNTDTAETAAFAGSVTGAGSLAKKGQGVQTLSGANTFAGGLSVTGGELVLSGTSAHAGATLVDASRLVLSGSGALTATSGINISNTAVLVLDNTANNSSDRIADGVGLALGVGTLRLLGNASAATAETIGGLTVNPGASFVEVVRGGTQTARLTLGGWTANTGGTVEFAGGTGTLGGDERVFITGGLGLLVNGIIPYATVGGQLATYDAGLGVIAASTFADDININLASANVRLDASSTLAQRTLANAGVTTDNSLTLSDGVSVELGDLSTRTLNLFSGGLAVTDGVSTISGAGRLTAGGTAASDLSVFINTGARLTINSTIQNNAGGGAVSLVKSGEGVLLLGGSNTHTGNTFINQGTLAINNTARLGAAGADVVMSGGTLATYGANLTFSGTGASLKEFFLTADTTNTFDIAGNAFDATNRSFTLGAAGNLAGSGTLVKTGGGSFIITQANTGFSGDVLVNQGTLQLQAADALGAGATKSHITLSGGTRLNLRNNAFADFGNDIRITGNATIDVRRASGSLSDQTLQLGDIEIGAHTLTVSGSNNYALAADRVILTGAATFNTSTTTSPFIVLGGITGEYGFTKSGSGVMRLDGAATNTGNITVTGGILRLGANERISDLSRVTFTASSTLDLNGFTETIGSLQGTTGTVATNGGTLILGRDNTTSNFSGTVTGTDGQIVKEGTGTFTYGGSSTNTYTGQTEVRSGTLVLGRSGTDRSIAGNLAVGDGIGASASAVVRFTAVNQISNTSAVTVRSDGLLDFNSRGDTIGSLGFAGGSVTLGTATLTVAGGVSSTASTSSATLSGGTLALGAGAKVFDIANGSAAADLTVSSLLTGSGEIQKTGDGRLVLDAVNTGFTGDIRIDAGTLALGRDNTFAIGNDVNLDGGTLELNNTTHTLGDMHVTADSILEFNTVASWLQVGKLVIDEGVTLTVNNWTEAVDHFCVRDPSELVLTRIIFAGFDASATRLFDTGGGCFIISPVPEPSTYGALSVGALLGLFVLRRRPRPPAVRAAPRRLV